MATTKLVRVITIELEYDPAIDETEENFQALSAQDVLECGTVVHDDTETREAE